MRTKLSLALKTLSVTVLILAFQNCAKPKSSSDEQDPLCDSSSALGRPVSKGTGTKTISVVDSCVDAGGKVEAYTASEGGSVDLCVFGGGNWQQSIFEALTWHRAQQGEAPRAMASMHYCEGANCCQEAGGQRQVVSSIEGQQITMCKFPDDSSVEERTLFRGEVYMTGGAILCRKQ